jgi:hypothetical protein
MGIKVEPVAEVDDKYTLLQAMAIFLVVSVVQNPKLLLT